MPSCQEEDFWKFYRKTDKGQCEHMFLKWFHYICLMANNKTSSQSHALYLLPGLWVKFHGSHWLQAQATCLKLLLNLRAKAITSYFHLHPSTDINTYCLSPRSCKDLGFSQNWGLEYTLFKRYPLKKEYTRSNSGHCYKTLALLKKIKVRWKSWHCSPFLFFNLLISSHSPYCSLYSEK